MIKINGELVTEKEFDFACDEIKKKIGAKKLTSEYIDAIADQLIGSRLLLQQAKKGETSIDDKSINEILNKIKANFPDEKSFKETLNITGDSEETLKVKIKDDLLLREFLNKNFYSKYSISEANAQKYYEENIDSFKTNDEVKASHILFDTNDEAKAKDVLTEIKNGASFEEMAETHSKCPSKSNGGDLGFFGKGMMVKEFEQAAFDTEVGKITDLVKTQFGYHIIKVTDKKTAGVSKFEDVKDELISHLSEDISNMRIEEFIDNLRKDSDIQIDQKILSSKK